MKKNKPVTFSNLYITCTTTKAADIETILKTDCNFMHRIVTGYEAGRPFNLEQILQHEIMPVLVSIVEMNGSLKPENKSFFAKVLTLNVNCKQAFSINGDSALIIDGITLVNLLGTS